MKGFSFAVLFLASVVVVGCSSPVSTDPNDYVGEYIFTPNEVVPADFVSFVILKKDHFAIESRFTQATSKITTLQKNWYLHRGTDEDVVIDKRAYPIERTRSGIKLVINGDLGQYYVKVR